MDDKQPTTTRLDEKAVRIPKELLERAQRLLRLALEEERERMAHEAARAYADEWVRGEER